MVYNIKVDRRINHAFLEPRLSACIAAAVDSGRYAVQSAGNRTVCIQGTLIPIIKKRTSNSFRRKPVQHLFAVLFHRRGIRKSELLQNSRYPHILFCGRFCDVSSLLSGKEAIELIIEIDRFNKIQPKKSIATIATFNRTLYTVSVHLSHLFKRAIRL